MDGKSFDSKKATWLERTLSLDEIEEVVFLMAIDEALGPNGFSMSFFQHC